MAGAMMVVSSSPMVPSSPACGFSPATASRGAAMLQSRAQRRFGHPAHGDDAVDRDHVQHAAQGGVHGDRHDAEHRAGQHHHRQPRPGQGGEELGVAGIGKAGAVEGGFVDRVGHYRGGDAGERQTGRLFDGGDDGSGVGGVGRAGARGDGERHGQHGQRVAKHRCGGLGGVHHPDGHVQAKRAGERFQAGRVIQRDKATAVPACEPGAQGKFTANTGGIAHSNGQRRKLYGMGCRGPLTGSRAEPWPPSFRYE